MSGSQDYLTDEIVDAFARAKVPWRLITPELARLKQRELDLDKQIRERWAELARALEPPRRLYFKIPARTP